MCLCGNVLTHICNKMSTFLAIRSNTRYRSKFGVMFSDILWKNVMCLDMGVGTILTRFTCAADGCAEAASGSCVCH